MNIFFLILHYKNIEETKECITSILTNIKYDKYEIIVVDNGSNNGTGEKLLHEYINEKKVKVLISEKNLGFARGNNLGFNYIKKQNKKNSFIVMINSDTIIKQKNFCEILIKKYEEYKFDVCGIDILLPNSKHTNPSISPISNVMDIKKLIKKKEFILKMYKANLGIFDILLTKLKQKIKIKKIDIKYDEDILLDKNTTMQLHGATLIFSPSFLNKYNGLYDGTFLYFEEVVLRYICNRDNLIVLYTPSMKIIHKMSQTTKMLYKNWKNRKIFYLENQLYSMKKVLNYIESDKCSIWKKE